MLSSDVRNKIDDPNEKGTKCLHSARATASKFVDFFFKNIVDNVGFPNLKQEMEFEQPVHMSDNIYLRLETNFVLNIVNL